MTHWVPENYAVLKKIDGDWVVHCFSQSLPFAKDSMKKVMGRKGVKDACVIEWQPCDSIHHKEPPDERSKKPDRNAPD